MLGELIARARGLDPEAVARLCDAMEDVLAEPDRKVGAALGISAARLRARDEALRKLAQALAAPGKSIAQIAREVCREARRRGIALSERHIRRIIE